MKDPKKTYSIFNQNLPNKNIHSNNSLANHFETATITIDNNDLTEIIFAEDLQTEKIHKIFRKIDINDRKEQSILQ